MSRLPVALAALVLAGSATAASPPSLRIRSLQPLRVQGLHFRSGERVRVTLVGSRRRARRVLVGAAGTFSVRFVDAAVDPCSSFSILAVGSSGDRARLRHKPLPACAPV